MELMMWIGGGLVVILIGCAVAGWKKGGEIGEKTNALKTREGFGGDAYISSDGSGLAINRSKKELVIFNGELEKSFPFASLVSAELLADEVSLTKTDRGSQIAGTAVGAALAGGVGALIGGLSASQKTGTGGVQKLKLRVIVDDFNSPTHDILFIDWKGVTGKGAATHDSPLWEHYFKEADKWYARIVSIIREESALRTSQQSTGSPEPSIADEIKKLSGLRDDGVLSDEEFDSAKSRLLNAPNPTS